MTVVRRTLAATAVLGIAAATAAVTAGTAGATTAVEQCTAGQVSTTLTPGDSGAGQRYAELRFTVAPGQTCTLIGSLPVHLTGAPGVTVAQEGGKHRAVTLSGGQSATMLLHWSAIEAPANQAVPSAVTVTMPATTDRHGHVTDPVVSLPWNLGGIDATADAHTLDAGAVTAA